MPTGVYDFTGGATGSITLTASDAARTAHYVGSASGSFNGVKVIGVSNDYYAGPNRFHNADNILFPQNEGFGNTFQGLDQSGVALNLADGSVIALYANPTSNGYVLSYVSSTGSGGPLTANYTGYVTAYCFLRGTRIKGPHGETRVEALAAGDLVVTSSGAVRPVRWIGRMIVRPTGHPKPEDVQPVRIVAGAFGPNLPLRDLILSPGHALYLDGGLVKACDLINDATIVQEQAETVEYFHVELDSHDILIAEGMPCESYLPDGNRENFFNGGDFVRLHGSVDGSYHAEACAPAMNGGAALAELRARLVERAKELGWEAIERADLCLSVDGRPISAMARVAGRSWYLLPEATTTARICSSSVRFDRMQPHSNDARRLGVAISEVRVDGKAAGSECFGDGFYAEEVLLHDTWRWTDGLAHLHLPEGATVLEIDVRSAALRFERCGADAALAAA